MLAIINIRHIFSTNEAESDKALQEFYYIMQLIMSNH